MKMHMKWMSVVMVSAALLLSVAACGKKEEAPAPATETPAAAPATNMTTAAPAAPEAPAAPAEKK